jgi:hypothetical protein
MGTHSIENLDFEIQESSDIRRSTVSQKPDNYYALARGFGT